jgi:hypothetical protein
MLVSTQALAENLARTGRLASIFGRVLAAADGLFFSALSNVKKIGKTFHSTDLTD